MMVAKTVALQGLDAERDVLRETQRLASERDRELETLRQQVRYLELLCQFVLTKPYQHYSVYTG